MDNLGETGHLIWASVIKILEVLETYPDGQRWVDYNGSFHFHLGYRLIIPV